jgi:excinuclease UvrABC helicase subunit UvrB
LPHLEIDSMTPTEKKRLIKNLTTEMKIAAESLDFELAAEIRDKIKEIG